MNKELRLEELRNELIGRETEFMELDNYMISKGFYSVWEDGIIEEVRKDKNVIYTFIDVDEASQNNGEQIQIFFDITLDVDKDGLVGTFELEIASIEPY